MMEFLKYSPDHLIACLRIFDTNCPGAFAKWERPEFEEWLNDRTTANPYWVQKVGGEIIGCGGIYTSDDHHKDSKYGQEVGFAWGMVQKNLQGNGYGKALFQFRLDYILQHFSDWPIILRTSQHANTFFEQFGFKTQEYTENGWDEGLHKYEMKYQGK